MLLNVVWLVLSGFWLAVGYALAGVLMVIPIVTIPFAIASFRLAGLWIAIGHVVTAVALFLTIIGIPLAIANVKLAAVAIAPLGKEIVDVDDPRAAAAGIW